MTWTLHEYVIKKHKNRVAPELLGGGCLLQPAPGCEIYTNVKISNNYMYGLHQFVIPQ